MKKFDLKKYISENIIETGMHKKAILSEGLKVGSKYSLLDSGINQWNDNFEYLGYDLNNKEHVFRSPDSPGKFTFQMLGNSELKKSVKNN